MFFNFFFGIYYSNNLKISAKESRFQKSLNERIFRYISIDRQVAPSQHFNVAQRWYNVSARRWNNVETTLHNVETTLYNVGTTLTQRGFNLTSTLVKPILNPIGMVMLVDCVIVIHVKYMNSIYSTKWESIF